MAFAAKPKKKVDALNKRIPENPRYRHVKPVVDTGASLSKYMEKMDDIRKNYRYRPDEIFRRIKVTTFAQLILQVFTVPELDDATPHEPAAQPLEAPALSSPEDPPSSSRTSSSLESVIRGVGELTVEEDTSPSLSLTAEEQMMSLPYLLLDVRDRDDYEQCHAITAHSYPATMLSRSCNYFTKEILYFKNRPGKIIILYDEDERIASTAATTFVQRDVENVFMLSGGLKVLNKAFSRGMIIGTVPASCQITTGRRTASASRTPTATSSQKAASAAKPRVSQVGWFSAEDLAEVDASLNDALMSADSASRLSSRTTSRTTSAGGRVTSTPAGSKAGAQRSTASRQARP